MDDKEETATNVRRTRSGKVVSTPPTKTAAKPTTRRTRKKVVLMEVEVSDDEEEIVKEDQVDSENKEEEESELEKKLLEDPAENDELTENKSDTNCSSTEIEQDGNENKSELNGSEKNGEIIKDNEDSIGIIFNDVDMLETPEAENENTESESVEVEKKDSAPEKMEVDEEKEDEAPVENITEDVEKQDATMEAEPNGLTETEIVKDDTPIAESNTEVAEKQDSEQVVEKREKVQIVEKQEKEQVVEKQEKEQVVEKLEKEQVVEKQEKEQVVEKQEKEQVVEKQEKELVVEKQKKELVAEKQEKEQVVEKQEKEQVVEKIVEESVDDKMEEVKDTEAPEPKTSKTNEEKQLSEKTEQPVVAEDAEEDKIKLDLQDDIISEEGNEDTVKDKKKKDDKQNGDPDAENISEDELPGVPVVKVPEAEEVSDEELPGPKRAELPADTEVVSEDELPSVKNEPKKEGVKRKLEEGDYDPGSPTSENEVPSKKPSLDTSVEKEKDEKSAKPKKLPELDKYWKAVNDDPTDFTGWTYLLQYVDQENDMEAAREAYDAFLSHYPYCYGYWRKYADYEKRKGNKKKCEEVFERGLKAIPLSVDLWIHYLTYVKTTRPDDEEYVRSQFERALAACGLEFRSDRLWDSYIKWETEGKRLQRVTAIYDKLLATPTQGYTAHFDNFQEHISSNPPNKVVEVDEFLALRKEVRHMLKHDVTTETTVDNSDAPPGDEDQSKVISSDEETKSIRERIVSIRRKIHKGTVNAVTARWNYEEGIKRPYFHVKPLERCQLKNWQDYLDYETEQGDRVRIIVLFERCLIACALYEEFWIKFVHYLEGLKDPELQPKIRDVYERACTIHHLKKPNLHLQWAMFEESVDNCSRAAEILVNLEKSVPNVLQIAYRRINLERRRGENEKCMQLYEHYINNSKNKMISSNIAIKYSRFCLRVLKDLEKAQEVLRTAITKDPNNPRLYLQLIDLTLQKDNVKESEILEIIDSFLDKESTDSEQKVLFAQRKLEYLEDFGTDIQSVQTAYEQYQKFIKQNKENVKKKEVKSDAAVTNKKDKSAAQSSSQSSSYGGYSNYGTSSNQPSYPYSGSQQGQYGYSQYGQGDQYQYQNWQYPQGSYGGYNQWGSYGGGYGY